MDHQWCRSELANISSECDSVIAVMDEIVSRLDLLRSTSMSIIQDSSSANDVIQVILFMRTSILEQSDVIRKCAAQIEHIRCTPPERPEEEQKENNVHQY